MKGALVLVALAATIVVALGMQQVRVDPRPEEVFTVMDEIQVREELPGGKMVRGNSLYRRCEDANGNLAAKGIWVYYRREGGRYTFSEGCWR